MQSLLIILFGTTILYMFAASRIEAFIKTLALQGLLLFLLVVIDLREINLLNIAFLGLETLVVKTVVIPLFLLRVIRRNEIGREVEPHRPQFFRLLLGAGHLPVRLPDRLLGGPDRPHRPAALFRDVHRHDDRQPVPHRQPQADHHPHPVLHDPRERHLPAVALGRPRDAHADQPGRPAGPLRRACTCWGSSSTPSNPSTTAGTIDVLSKLKD